MRSHLLRVPLKVSKLNDDLQEMPQENDGFAVERCAPQPVGDQECVGALNILNPCIALKGAPRRADRLAFPVEVLELQQFVDDKTKPPVSVRKGRSGGASSHFLRIPDDGNIGNSFSHTLAV